MYGFQMESCVVAEFGGFSPLKSGGGAAGKRTFHSRERGNLYASLCDANYRRFATQTDSRVRGNGMRGQMSGASRGGGNDGGAAGFCRQESDGGGGDSDLHRNGKN